MNRIIRPEPDEARADDIRMDLRFRRDLADGGPPRDRPTYYVDVSDASLPEAHHVERVEFVGLLALGWATLWCRQNSRAIAGSPVPWDTEVVHPWVLELHGIWPDSYGGARLGVAFSMPCSVDPRVPSVEADAAIRAVVRRALLHEGQEGTLIDGVRLDPHEVGELGLVLKDIDS
jgi:hypothetical protein